LLLLKSMNRLFLALFTTILLLPYDALAVKQVVDSTYFYGVLDSLETSVKAEKSVIRHQLRLPDDPNDTRPINISEAKNWFETSHQGLYAQICDMKHLEKKGHSCSSAGSLAGRRDLVAVTRDMSKAQLGARLDYLTRLQQRLVETRARQQRGQLNGWEIGWEAAPSISKGHFEIPSKFTIEFPGKLRSDAHDFATAPVVAEELPPQFTVSPASAPQAD
jgi:hypothetical protein